MTLKKKNNNSHQSMPTSIRITMTTKPTVWFVKRESPSMKEYKMSTPS